MDEAIVARLGGQAICHDQPTAACSRRRHLPGLQLIDHPSTCAVLLCFIMPRVALFDYVLSVVCSVLNVRMLTSWLGLITVKTELGYCREWA